MSETNTKQTTNPGDEEVTLTLKKSEIFQINLSLTTRLSYVQTRWASAITQQEQVACENQIDYLTGLQAKLASLLNSSN